MINIRVEQELDYKIVEDVIENAFLNAELTDNQEHNLVNRLRKSSEFIPELSLVAEIDNKIVGHILFTKINIESNKESFESLALAPLSVLLDYQNKGVGKALMNYGLEVAKNLGYESVVVLGHENYYPKFGFKKASEFDIKPPFEVPDEAFMALELNENGLKNVSGIVKYSNAFFE
ncbi:MULTISPECIES: GNAT family N-acetyltransferase [Romboutsia]|jgi:predicted N-acetyltransferase YhbS|uniref:GNAT family N-acetyltransferase n=1 Tax=Romboutsia TaxID=1501226 RepID=UPI002171C407|nr:MULTISPECIES: N-acetyltransferase [Romboutsia]MCI9061206.1 N-acetyltransferase [Romboutsia sp.]